MTASTRLQRFNDRFISFLVHHVNQLKDPESMIALFIATLWAVFAGAWGGWVVILIFAVIIWTLHVLSVETGSHVVLWLTTSALLVLIIIGSEATFGGLSAVLLAAGGATALAYNELVRLNYTRRRNAVVDESVFVASALGLGGAAGIGIIGVGLAQAFADGQERTWVWMPAAVGALMLVGFALAIGPIRRANEASKQRWQPGERIPPQPLGKDDLEQF